MDKQQMLSHRLDGWTFARIAVAAGKSTQRVQQILSPPKAIRQYVKDKFMGMCNECDLLVNERGHIHHKTTNIGPDDYNDIENLELLCASCHRHKHYRGLGPRTVPVQTIKLTTYVKCPHIHMDGKPCGHEWIIHTTDPRGPAQCPKCRFRMRTRSKK